MAAYALVEIDVIDPDTYARYREVAPAIVAAFGGTYLTCGGATETVEGTWQPQRLIILEFPSLDRLQAFYNAPASADARPCASAQPRAPWSSARASNGVPARHARTCGAG